MKRMGLAGAAFVISVVLMSSLQARAGELHDAAENGDIAKVRQLLQQGADVNARDQYQRTPLHHAAFFGKTDVARLLIEKGADVNAENQVQGTPLNEAASNGYTDVAKLLIEKGADVNAKDNVHSTPLHHAAFSGKTEVAKLLIEKGADVNAMNYFHDTPAMVAEKNNHPELAAMILQARSLTPSPSVPQEARDEMMKGAAAFKLAKRPEDFAEAEVHFAKASQLAPWLPEPYFNLTLAQEKLALARGQQDKFLDAKRSLEKYLGAVTDPRDVQTGKRKMAELDLETKHYKDFSDEANVGGRAVAKGPSGYNEAAQHLKRALEMYPDHPYADIVYNMLGYIYEEQGDLDSAYKYMQKVFELVPEPSDTGRYVNMGLVLEKRGDLAKACIYYKKGCALGNQVGCGNMRGKCP